MKNNQNYNNIVKYLQQTKVFNSLTKATNFILKLLKTMKINRNRLITELNDENFEYSKIISNIENFIEKFQIKQLEFNNKLAIISKEQVDYEHYIEFNVLSASMGYYAYKMFHDSRVERRNVKDEIAKINIILSKFKSNIDFEQIKSALNKINKQVYTPTIKFDLFK